MTDDEQAFAKAVQRLAEERVGLNTGAKAGHPLRVGKAAPQTTLATCRGPSDRHAPLSANIPNLPATIGPTPSPWLRQSRTRARRRLEGDGHDDDRSLMRPELIQTPTYFTTSSSRTARFYLCSRKPISRRSTSIETMEVSPANACSTMTRPSTKRISISLA